MDDEPIWAADRVVAPTPSSAITIPKTANEFTIKGNHLNLVKGNQFDGRIKTDPHKQIHEFLGICDMFKYRDTKYEVVRLMMFPLSLTSEAKSWLDELNEGTIKTWDELHIAFISSSNSDTDKIMTRMDAMTMKMDAQYKEMQSRSNHLIPEYDEDDKPMSPEAEAKFIKAFHTSIYIWLYRDQLADKQSGRPCGSLPSNTQPNLNGSSSKPYQPPQARNEHVNIVFTRSGKSYDPPTNPNDQQNSETLNNFDSELCYDPKQREVSLFPSRLKISKAFSCNALADLGASINLMPYSLYTKLYLETLKPTKMSVRLADRLFQHPIGIAENMLVEVGKFTFPVDFVILEMEEDSKVPLILGRPFLHIVNAIIRVKQKQLNLGVENYESESKSEEPPFKKITFNTDYKIKTSIEEPPSDLELKHLPNHLEYVFLEESSFLPVIISSQLSEQNKKVFMDDFSVFENSFDKCLNNFDKMLQRCKDANLVLNWEKCHFMVKEGIVLRHKVSGAGLKVDKAKIDVVSKIPPPTNVKAIRSFLGHAGFFRKFIKDFLKIARPLTKLLEKDTPFEFNDECHKAFNSLKEKLTCTPVIQDAKPRLIRWILLLQEFDIEIKDKKGTENVAADHLSRIDNDETSDDSEVDDYYPIETLMEITTKDTPWFADFANYLVDKAIYSASVVEIAMLFCFFEDHLTNLSPKNCALPEQKARILSLNEDILKITILKTNTPYPSRKIRLRMTKFIKGECEKIKDVKVEDVSLTCDTSLEVFNNEVNLLSGMDDDLFTFEVEVANIPCDSKMDDDSEHEADDDMGYDPSDIIGDDEVAKVFRIDANLFNFETPMCKAFKEFNYLLQIVPDLLTKDIEGFKTYEDYKDDWIYEWNKDIPWVDEKPWTNDYEWYEALEDSELKDKALRNKAIKEGFIKEDDDESRYEQMRRWNINANYDDAYETNHRDNKSEELCEVNELPMCNIRRYMMIKYSFNNDGEYVAIKEDEYDDPTITREEACRAYQEIFWKIDEGWMVTRAE
ncbi:reverse transcriptase domain-containing protein [Tanacetum coccineum]